MIFCESSWVFWFIFLIIIGFLFILGRHLIVTTPSTTFNSTSKKVDIAIPTEGTPPDRQTLYNASIQLIIHAENTSWTRIINFLTADSILMLAWATIFASSDLANKAWVLIIMSLVGFLLSIVWAPFGSRGRRYFKRYVDIAKALEQNISENGQVCDGPVNSGEKLKFLSWEQLCRSQNLAVIVLLFFAAAFFFVFLKSISLYLKQ